MPPLTLPLTFSNSFWSQDYRSGLQVLYSKIEQGIAENDEIVNFVKARVRAERELAKTLSNPAPTASSEGAGFGTDDGASLYMAFRGLQHESVAQGQAHSAIAKDLQEQVADPFEVWSYQHAERIQASKEDILDGWLARYETHINDVSKIRETYLTKCRKADEAEDDAKFAPNNDLQEAEKFTEIPARLTPSSSIRRTPSFADRLSQRLKDNSRELSAAQPPPMPEPKNTMEMLAAEKLAAEMDEKKAEGADEAKSDGTITPKIDKGKDLNIAIPLGTTPAVTVTTHIILGNASIAAADVSALLFRAQQEIGVRNVKFTLLGEYEHCFTGEEFVVWLKMNVEGVNGSLDIAEEAAKVLTEDYGALRRIGELGNKFDNSPTAFFQFRPKAFTLQAALQRTSKGSTDSSMPSPISDMAGGLKRSNTMVSYLVKAVQNATAPTHSDEPPYIRARKEAGAADLSYRKAAKQLDQHRCAVEEKIDEILKALQRWELERLKAVKTVLLQYQGILASLHGPVAASNEKSSILISSFVPENDVKALIERYRTGPFRPDPKLYESVTHETDASFGIDLRKWAGEGAFSPIRSISSMDEIVAVGARNLPPVLTGLLEALRRTYPKAENDSVRRMTWIYEVPLPTVHHLRATLNALPFNMPIESAIFDHYDPPVLASTVKLWLLELNPPVALWEGWDDVKKVYPSVGAHFEEGSKDIEEELQNVLGRLPTAGLKVLDAIVAHLKELIDTTKTDESNDVFIMKLALSMGRSVLRPKQENSMSIQSTHAPLFFADLIKHYASVLPPTLDRKRRESVQRAMPKRQRTKLIDARQMRRSVDATADPRKLLEAQFMLKNPTSRPGSPGPANGSVRPTFISPPSTPPIGVQGILPPVLTTGQPEGDSFLLKADGEGTPSVAIEPPSPINLNEEAAKKPFIAPPPPPPIFSPAQVPESVGPIAELGGPTPQDEPFTPPVAASKKPGSPTPGSPRRSDDVSLANGPSGLARAGSQEGSRLRGPRVAARGGGPRPLSLAGSARPAPSSVASPPLRGGSPRNSISGPPGRAPSPAAEARAALRPRTPPDAKDYMPTKRGGRAAAGSFSRTRPMGEL